MTRRSSSRPALCFHRGTVRQGLDIKTMKHLSNSSGILNDTSWHSFQTFSSLQKGTQQRHVNWIFLSSYQKAEFQQKYLPITRHMWALISFRKQLFQCFIASYIIFVATHVNLCIDRHFDTLTVATFFVHAEQMQMLKKLVLPTKYWFSPLWLSNIIMFDHARMCAYRQGINHTCERNSTSTHSTPLQKA